MNNKSFTSRYLKNKFKNAEIIVPFLFQCFFESAGYILPVGDVENGLNIVSSNILVLKVVSMLPDVDAKKRNKTCGLKEDYNSFSYKKVLGKY